MIEAENTGGQMLAILLIAAFCAAWVLIALRREKVRARTRLRRIEKVSGVDRTVGHITEDRSEQ